MCLADSLHTIKSNSWLIGGDLNQLLAASDKFGGDRINHFRTSIFRDYLNHCNLLDLGFRESKFT